MSRLMKAIQYKEHRDEELTRLAGAGEEQALEELYSRYREMIRAKSNLYFIVGGDRDDLIQEGMIGMFHAIMEYNAQRGASFETFAELCVERQMVSAIKSAGRLKHTPLNTSVSMSAEREDANGERISIEESIADYADSPEVEVLIKDQIAGIERERNRIFSKLERVVWDEFKKGRTYTEIAAALGHTPKTIDNAIQRMKKKVERHMEQY